MWKDKLAREYRETAGAVIERLQEYPSVKGLALFGSVTRGGVWEGSDIDVLMLVDRSDSDWQAYELRHGPWHVHLQVISTKAMEQKSELLRAAALGELIVNAAIAYDPDGLLLRLIRAKREECRLYQFTEIVSACLRFLSEFRNAQRQLSLGDIDSAFLCSNLAFAALTDVELSRMGFPPLRRPPGFETMAPKLTKAYRNLITGSAGLRERIRLSFIFFDRKVNELVENISPSVVHAVERAGMPLPVEDFGELPEIANTSSEIQYLIDALERHGVILLKRRQALLGGYPLHGLESLLVEINR